MAERPLHIGSVKPMFKRRNYFMGGHSADEMGFLLVTTHTPS